MSEPVWISRSRDIALKVNAALAAQKMTKQELASRLGVSPQYVSKLVRGGENLTLETLSKLEAALGISLSGEGRRQFRRHEGSAYGTSPFLTYSTCSVNPEIRVRKALVFEGNIPESLEPDQVRVWYKSHCSARTPEDEMCVTSYIQYQVDSRLCADIELTFAFTVRDLGRSLRIAGDGKFDCEEGLLESLLVEACAGARGYAAALFGATALRGYPLPEYDIEALLACNSLSA